MHATGPLLNITKCKSTKSIVKRKIYFDHFHFSFFFLSAGNPVEILVGISVASFSSIKEVDMVNTF